MEESQDNREVPVAMVGDGVQLYLRQTRPWVILVAIFMFIGAGLSLLMGAVVMVFAASASRVSEGGGPITGVVAVLLGAVYVAIALLYVPPGVFLSKYAIAIRRLLADHSPASLEQAMKDQRSFWRFAGIMVIVCIVLFVVGIGAAILIPALVAMHGARTSF